MSIVSKLSVYNFRTHDHKIVDLSSDVIVITGKNGVGKTSLIEAIFVALQGKSFKGVDDDILKHQKDWWKIDLVMTNQEIRSVTYNQAKNQNKKIFKIDGKINYRLPRTKIYPVVLFEPDDLRLLHGSPTRRRQFIDGLISQVNPYFREVTRKYDRALRQRNTLLKCSSLSKNDLFVWDIALSKYGAYIIDQRNIMTSKINNQLNQVYEKITGSGDSIIMRYSEKTDDNSPQQILHDLQKSLDKDRIVKFTTVGPHRHDVLFDYNNSTASAGASRGETRSIVLALKMIEIDIIKDTTKINPLVLLDDVYSELDEDRQKLLQKNVGSQAIITTTINTSKITKSKEIKLV